MKNKLIDTHCHLDYLKKQSINETIAMSLEQNVEKIITIAVEPNNLDTVINLAHDFEQVFCSQGIHPHDARLWNGQTREKIIKNAQNKKVVAIGEIGLDYHYDNSPRNIQQKVFEEQLQIACDLNLPIIIHTREAEEDTKNILNNFKGNIKKSGVVHCFSSDINFAEYFFEQNFMLGFNGIITFKPAKNVREVLKATPDNLILLETDAPYLTPIPHRGKENAPFYLPYIAKKCAEIKNIHYDQFVTTVYTNSSNLFGF